MSDKEPGTLHFVLTGNAVSSSHSSKDEAQTAAVKVALTGKSAYVAELISTVEPNKGVTITAADGTTTQAQ